MDEAIPSILAIASSYLRNRYTYFASAARKEGFEQIANIFIETAENEKEHAKAFFKYLEGVDGESRYRKLINNMANAEVFKKKAAVKWHCINCGYVSEGTEPPKECPACKHPQSFFEALAENY